MSVWVKRRVRETKREAMSWELEVAVAVVVALEVAVRREVVKIMYGERA